MVPCTVHGSKSSVVCGRRKPYYSNSARGSSQSRVHRSEARSDASYLELTTIAIVLTPLHSLLCLALHKTGDMARDTS